jgi:hypothetical protein
MKIPLYLLLFSVLVISCSPDRQGGTENTETEIEVGEQDESDIASMEDLIIHAMINNRLHAALAEQMKGKSYNTKVEILRDMILQDYEEYQYNLGLLASTYEIEIPQGLTPRAQEQYDRISGLETDNFIGEFVDLLIKNHQEDLDRFETILAADNEVMERGILEGLHDTAEKHLDAVVDLNKDET